MQYIRKKNTKITMLHITQCRIQVYRQSSIAVLDMTLMIVSYELLYWEHESNYHVSIPLCISLGWYTFPYPHSHSYLDILFTVSLVESDGYVMALLCAGLVFTAPRTTNWAGVGAGGGGVIGQAVGENKYVCSSVASLSINIFCGLTSVYKFYSI